MYTGRILTAADIVSKRNIYTKSLEIDHLESASKDILDLIATIDALVIERNVLGQQLEDEYGTQSEYDYLRKPGILDGYEPQDEQP